MAEPELTLRLLAERIAAEQLLRETTEKYVREALELQALEYGRRLDTLNHAHQQAMEAQARTVPREVFEQYVKESAARVEQALVAITARHEATDDAQTERTTAALAVHRSDIEALNNRVDEIQSWRSGIEGRTIGIMAAISIVVIVINIALRFL